MLQIADVLAPLFLIVLVSALIEKFFRLGNDWPRVLNEYALNIGFPVLIFSSLARSNVPLTEESGLLIANSLLFIAVFMIALAAGSLLRLRVRTLRTVVICSVFSNVAYLGIPILVQTFGESILPTAGLIAAVYLFWIFTVGIGYLTVSDGEHSRFSVKKIFYDLIRNPLLLAVIAGITVSALRITFPQAVTQAMQMVTASVTPTVLIVIGLFIGNSTFGKIADWYPVLLFAAGVLIATPALFYLGILLCGADPHRLSASIIQAAMPVAITPFALADRYGLDREFIARAIVLTTILSVISLPFWIAALTH